MDTFSRHRTFLVIIVILLIFLFLFYYHIQRLFQESFRMNSEIKSLWKSGIPVYIDKTNTTTTYSNKKTPVTRENVTGKGGCDEICKNQSECIDEGNKWKQKCSSDFVDGDCYCKFQKVPKEGFSVLKEYKGIIKSYPNSGKPSWRDITSQNKWISLSKIRPAISWENLAVSNINHMSVSFWIYFKEDIDKKRGFVEIFSIKTLNKLNFACAALPATPVLNFGTNTDAGIEIDKTPHTHKSDMTGGYEIGYGHKSTFVVATITNGKVDVYFNGRWKNTSGNSAILPTDDTTLLKFGNNGKSIIMKDFKIYDKSIPSVDVNLLYDNIKNEGNFDFMEERKGGIESFDSIHLNTLSIFREKMKGMTDWFNSNKESFVTKAVINEEKISLESAKKRSETKEKCNRSKDAKIRANHQKSPFHDTYHVDRAYMKFENGRIVDFTKEVRSVLETQPYRVGGLTEYGVTTSKKLFIEIMHPWSKKTTVFDVLYEPNVPFQWKILSDRVKCINSDDTQWNEDEKKCTDINQSLVCSSNEHRDCVNYTAFKKLGRCSGEQNLQYKNDTIRLANGNNRVIQYIQLDSGSHDNLELTTSKEMDKRTMFTSKGTTILMWVKIDPSLRESSNKECVLLNFGNSNWNKLDNELKISIGNNPLLDNIVFKSDNERVHDLGTQILDNEWHHIAWVLKPANDEEKEKASWTIYHNGIKLGTRTREYPKNLYRNTKILGGGRKRSEFWGPSIGEFYVYGTALEEKTIDGIYQYGMN